MTPRSETTAFRIWAMAEPLGWNITIANLAAELDETAQHISGVCSSKGWLGRLRVGKRTNDAGQAGWGASGEFDGQPNNDIAQHIRVSAGS